MSLSESQKIDLYNINSCILSFICKEYDVFDFYNMVILRTRYEKIANFKNFEGNEFVEHVLRDYTKMYGDKKFERASNTVDVMGKAWLICVPSDIREIITSEVRSLDDKDLHDYLVKMKAKISPPISY